MKLRCLIVEDEPPAQEIMKTYAEDCPQLELVGICPDAYAAAEVIRSEEIDLLLLDINLPRLSGLSLMKTLNRPPMVIFTTAYPEYAVEGFETDAVDYLVKPFSFERFLKAVNKAADKKRAMQSGEIPSRKNENSFILLRADKRVFRVSFSEIFYVEATGDYLKVFLEGRTLVIHGTIRNFLDRLPPGDFIRVHKSFIVSVNRIIYIEGNRIRIGEQFIPIGRSYKDMVESQLGRR